MEKASTPPSKKLKTECQTSQSGADLSPVKNICEDLKSADVTVQTSALKRIRNLLSRNTSNANSDVLQPVLCELKIFVALGSRNCYYCTQNGILEVLAKIGTLNLLPLTTSIIHTLCQHCCSHLLPETASLLFNRLYLLLCNRNSEILIPVLYSMTYFTQAQAQTFKLPKEIYSCFLCLINYHEITVQTIAFCAFGNVINGCFEQMPKCIIKVIINDFMGLFLQPHEALIHKMGLSFLIKVAKDAEYIEYIINAKLIPEIANLLHSNDSNIQAIATKLLQNISSNSKEGMQEILKANIGKCLIQITTSINIDARIAALGVIANMTAFDLNQRDNFIDLKIVNRLLTVLNGEKPPNLMEQFARILFSILREPFPSELIVGSLFPLVVKFALNSHCANVKVSSLEVLSNATREIPGTIDIYINQEVVSRLFELLEHENVDVQKAVLNLFDTISTTNEQKQHLIEYEILNEISSLSKDPSETMNIQALTLLAMIANGNHTQIQAIINADLITVLIDLMNKKSFAVKKEAVNVLSKLPANGSLQQLMTVFKVDLLMPFFEFLLQCYTHTVIPHLEAFKLICEKANGPDLIEFRQNVFKAGGKSALFKLYDKKDSEICAILSGCFSALDLQIAQITDIPDFN